MKYKEKKLWHGSRVAHGILWFFRRYLLEFFDGVRARVSDENWCVLRLSFSMLGGFSRLTRFWLFINDEENILILGPFAFQTSCVELLSFLDHTNRTTVNESEIVLISFRSPSFHGVSKTSTQHAENYAPVKMTKDDRQRRKICKLEWFSIQFEEIVMSHREKLSSIITFLYSFMVFVNFTQYRRESCAIERRVERFQWENLRVTETRIMHSISHMIQWNFNFNPHHTIIFAPVRSRINTFIDHIIFLQQLPTFAAHLVYGENYDFYFFRLHSPRPARRSRVLFQFQLSRCRRSMIIGHLK